MLLVGIGDAGGLSYKKSAEEVADFIGRGGAAHVEKDHGRWAAR